MELADKNVLVAGFGISGRAVADFCLQQGSRLTVADAQPANGIDAALRADFEAKGVNFLWGDPWETGFEGADLILLSPGVPHDLPSMEKARQKGVPVLGELELAARFWQKPMAAVSGTNGKTTVTTLVGDMLKAGGKRVFVGGNIGRPLVSAVNDQEQWDLAVIEVSSFQLDTIRRFSPQVAVLLNIAEDHLDRYPDVDAYVASKGRLFENQGAGDTAVFNAGDKSVCRLAGASGAAKKWGFGRNPGLAAEVRADRIKWVLPDRPVFELETKNIRQSKPFQLENAAAAGLAALGLGAGEAAIETVLAAFEGLPHRLQTVAMVNGITFINDSKATNVDAVRRAIEAVAEPVVLILGGRDKGNDYKPLRGLVQARVRAVVAMGEAAGDIARFFKPLTPVFMAADITRAVRQAAQYARAGEVVLFSPACASFDQFTSYAARGNAFCQAVKGLA